MGSVTKIYLAKVLLKNNFVESQKLHFKQAMNIVIGSHLHAAIKNSNCLKIF